MQHLRVDHDPQRQLLQVQQLRHDLGLRLERFDRRWILLTQRASLAQAARCALHLSPPVPKPSVLDLINTPDQWLASADYGGDEQAFLRRFLADLSWRALLRWQRHGEVPRVSLRRLAHRPGHSIVLIPPNGEQPDRFEFWVDEHYIPESKRATRPARLLAEVRKTARILKASLDATLAETVYVSGAANAPAPTERTAALRDQLLAEWRGLAADTRRLMRCVGPGCAVDGGAYFVQRTVERRCPTCRAERQGRVGRRDSNPAG